MQCHMPCRVWRGWETQTWLCRLCLSQSLCLSQPHPCLSSSLHIGHHSEQHIILVAWLWLIGMRPSLCWVVWSKWGWVRELQPTWVLCGKMTCWSQHVCFFLLVSVTRKHRGTSTEGYGRSLARDRFHGGGRGNAVKTMRERRPIE